jgi:hypothetical protein
MIAQADPVLSITSRVPDWTGVVMVERPDMTRASHVPFAHGPMCPVRSARSAAYNGRRAIVCQLPYQMLAQFFTSADEDHVFVWAELHGEHLELRERASLKEWAETAHIGAPVH